MTDADLIQPLPVQGAKSTLSHDSDVRAFIPRGVQIRKPVRYGDDVWGVDGYPVVNQSVKGIDFTGIPRRWRSVVKDWILLRLNPSLARNGMSGLDTTASNALALAAAPPVTMMTAIAYVLTFKVTLPIVDAHGTSLTPQDWNSVVASVEARDAGNAPLTNALCALQLPALWKARHVLGLPNMFGGRPFAGESVMKVFKVPERGPNTARPDPEICGPILGLSLWIMDHCAEDILTRREHLAALPDRTHLSRDEQLAAVMIELHRWRETGRALPATVGLRGDTVTAAPSWATFVKMAGCSNKVLKNPVGPAVAAWAALRDERRVSATEDGFDLPIRQVEALDGSLRQWTDSLVATRYGNGLDYWTSLLAFACAYVVALLTTVRDREFSALPDDCIRSDTYERGDADIPVTRMRGFLIKNVPEPRPATWVISEDVVRAVGIVKRLKKALRLSPRLHPLTGEEILFHPGLGLGPVTKTDSMVLQHEWLRRFERAGEFLSNRGLIAALPELPTWLSHRVIRITGIQCYASQPWGDALAAAQAHWSSRKVAEGYYGHLPNSVFIADPESVEEVRQVVLGQTLVNVAADITELGMEAAVHGRGDQRLDDALRRSEVYELTNEPVTGKQLVKIAKDNKNVTVGTFTICVFGPGGLCGGVHEANFRLCRPGACRNSAMTIGQRARQELARREHVGREGVFERARKKIEVDMPELKPEFENFTDPDLIELILNELPGSYATAARRQVPA
ncbi:hypothetical protein QUG92_11195 [Curtobacterium sp. RHCKG23]|uniref:Integrase n=1 Tax=Curtobacterium citri TaxID=3055139 RepID=A0ABT7T7W5_9MICO|nr:hypothetical protein [Curtobacterium citri]MDM7885669.1 hypothetical protein [Curtobacterium citri]